MVKKTLGLPKSDLTDGLFDLEDFFLNSAVRQEEKIYIMGLIRACMSLMTTET